MWVGVEATCEGGARRKEAQYNSRRGAGQQTVALVGLQLFTLKFSSNWSRVLR